MPKYTASIIRRVTTTAEIEFETEGDEEDRAQEELDRLIQKGELDKLDWTITEDEAEVESIEES